MGESIAVTSGKGGVGKTTVAINVAVALSQLGKSVVLVDGSLMTPDVSLHLGIPFHVRGLPSLLKEGSVTENASFTHKSGLKVIPSSIHIDDLREVEENEFPNLLKSLKERYDFVLVDSAAGLGEDAVSAIKNSDKIMVVVNPELPSVVDASKAIQMAMDLNVKPVGVVLNRLGRVRHELEEENTKILLHNVPVIGRVPEDRRVPQAIRNSDAVVSLYPGCRASREFRRIACRLSGLEVGRESFFSRWFGFLR